MTQYRKRPKIGDVIDGPTGPELVTRVYHYGERLDTVDDLRRTWLRERAPTGWWLLVADHDRARLAARETHLCAACSRMVDDTHEPEWQCVNAVCGVWFHGDVCPNCDTPHERED